MALGSLKSVAGVVEKWIGARVLDMGHFSWLFCKHNCDNGALHATPVLQFSSYTTPHLQPINFQVRADFVLSPESSPESSFCIDPCKRGVSAYSGLWTGLMDWTMD